MAEQQFGKKVGSLKALKKQLKRSKGGGPGFITYVPKDPGEITVRFLTEPDEFVMYEECWSKVLKRSFPWSEDLKENVDYDRKSTTYLANALDVNNDKVIAFQIKQTVMNSLTVKYERYETLTDRDYTIVRYGEGLDTEYDVTPEPPQKRNLSKYDLLDLQEVLRKAYENVFDENDDSDDEDEGRPVRKTASKKKKTSVAPGKRRVVRRGG